MTTEEAAAVLEVEVAEVVWLADYGLLPVQKVGGARQFTKQAVLAYKTSRDQYKERMGPIIKVGVASGGYDLRFRD